MEKQIIEACIGSSFDNVAYQAKTVATNLGKDGVAEFNFNGITCIVNKDTNLDNLHKHYSDAFTMKWTSVGPICEAEYTEYVQKELDKRNAKRELEYANMQSEYLEKQKDKKIKLNAKIEGVPFLYCAFGKDFLDSLKGANKDSYGERCVSYAEEWGRLMQVEISKLYSIVSANQVTPYVIGLVADKTSTEADYDGISGFMYGAAVNTLSKCWLYGDSIHEWHNNKYKYTGEGIVNPAIMVIGYVNH